MNGRPSVPAFETSRAEFALIARHFADLGPRRADVRLGVGDDCALLEVPVGHSLAVSIDTLTAGVHFFPDCAAEAVGHKALAVGLSDLAAMGAEPAWATLALTLPRQDDVWISGFAHGFGALARTHGVQLVGGDTTRGPLAISVQVHGLVPHDAAIRRAGARPDDRIWVSGTLGDAALALERLRAGVSPEPALRDRLERPTPRVALGLALRGLASAMIDLSDGLAGDLGHLLAASGVGAELDLAALPLAPPLVALIASNEGAWSLPLAGGDDYELCFCAPAARTEQIAALAARAGCQVSCIGRILQTPGLRLRRPDGRALGIERMGYDHFPREA